MLKTKNVLKGIFACTALLLLIVVLMNGWLLSASGATIVIETNLPDVPTEMYVLKTISKEITEEQVLDLASVIFSVNGEIQFTNGAWKVMEGSQEVLLYKSRSIKYFDNSKMWNDGYMPQELPPTTSCVAIAEQFLENLEAQGLVSGSLHISFAETANDTTVYALKNGTKTTLLNNIHVNFAISYDDVPLWGPGAKVRVYIGKEGEIIGFIGNFWEVEPAEKVQILTPEQAVEKLRELGYGISMSKDMVSKATVKSIELVYLAPSPEAETTQITPVYVIKGDLVGKDGSVGDLLQIVPAIP